MANGNFPFVEEGRDESKHFRAPRKQSLFVNGVTFAITGYRLGRYDGSSQDPKSQSVLLLTTLGEELNINRLLYCKRVVYSSDGLAKSISVCKFRQELVDHLDKLERDPSDDRFYAGAADDVAKHIVKFFEGKTIGCVEIPDVFVKYKDDTKLHIPGQPFVEFKFE